ncbi:MAG: cytochrome c3 family protein [Magnetococcus sp. DMHC-6]
MLFSFPMASYSSENAASVMESPDVFKVTSETENDKCNYCHAVKGFSTPTSDGRIQNRKDLFVNMEVFSKTVHASRRCVDCHTSIKEVPHVKSAKREKVNCIGCHQEQNQKPHEAATHKTLEKVVENIGMYMDSVHSKPRKGDPEQVNAYCTDCHEGHNIFAKGSEERKEFNRDSPKLCGKCHQKQLLTYENSVHGGDVLRWGDEKKPVCIDCHTTHMINLAKSSPGQLIITQSCGNCHKEQYQTYTGTYHGQVNSLGYVNTAKCFDCHESHDNKLVTDPASKVHKENREKTCKACHKDVSSGFLTFLPHANTHDFDKYPEMWLVSKGMIGLLIGVFAVFWTHTLLWFLRERKEKKLGLLHPHVPHETVVPVIPQTTGRRVNVQRFPPLWRLAHLSFALSIMVLGATGLTVLFANSFWAKTVSKLLGGPEVMAIIHRVAAVVFVGVFMIHLVVVLHKLLIKNRKTFKWFGPYSLVPRWQDLWDFLAMMKWFFGKGPRPIFDHWTYWEKFDYWAPFWGVSIIGGSGLVLWFPATAGEYLPGWIFNVATIFHGEEAVLAILFLFTVHFFNCHLRPSKFPLDIMMFVGSMPLEEFKHERAIEYQRVVEEGKLENLMVVPPTKKLTHYSRILGFSLLGIGLTLLFLALSGILTELTHYFFS